MRPPIAPVERILADEIDRAGDGAAIALGHDQKNMIAHRRADFREKFAGQIGRAPFARARIRVEMKKRVPMGFLDVGAGQKLDRDAVRQSLLALTPDHLALAGREIGEKSVEIRVALIDEMKLLPGALQEAARAERLPFGPRREGNVESTRLRLFRARREARRCSVKRAASPCPGATSSRRPVTGVKGTATCSLG